LLTVFRHAATASVHKGGLGDLPKTMWVLDYPLLERICATMVTGYSPYGPAERRMAARVRMDGLRQEAETQFLDFLPQEQRRNSLQYWYGGMDLQELDASPSSLPARIEFATDDAKREFVEYLVHHHSWSRPGSISMTTISKMASSIRSRCRNTGTSTNFCWACGRRRRRGLRISPMVRTARTAWPISGSMGRNGGMRSFRWCCTAGTMMSRSCARNGASILPATGSGSLPASSVHHRTISTMSMSTSCRHSSRSSAPIRPRRGLTNAWRSTGWMR